MNKSEKEKMVPVWLKTCLTLEEASACTGIGVGRLKMLSQADDGKITIWISALILLNTVTMLNAMRRFILGMLPKVKQE